MAPMNSDSQRPPVLLPHLQYTGTTIRWDLPNLFDKLLLPKLRELHVTLEHVLWPAVPHAYKSSRSYHAGFFRNLLSIKPRPTAAYMMVT